MNYRFLLTASIVCLIFLGLSSCIKNNKGVEWPDAAVLTVVHASPKSPRLEFALDNNRLHLYNFSYTSYLYNQLAYTGKRLLSVYKYGETNKIFSKEINLEKDKNYTIFLVDSLSKLDAVLLNNKTKAAHADSVKIKFANMCPDVPAMDFYIKGQPTPFATNVAYKSAADFVNVKAAADQVIEVRQAGQSNVLAASLPVSLSGRNIFTIYASGFKSITNNEGRVTVSTIRHTRPSG